jgi:hypothetical protein
LVSTGGRTITTLAAFTCFHNPTLRARSYANRVTLTLVVPILAQSNEFCSFDFGRQVLDVHTTLPAPLRRRRLVQASSGKPIPYFDANRFARLTVLPRGCRLSGGTPEGGYLSASYLADTRYCPDTKPALPLATLIVTQAIGRVAFDAKRGWPVLARPSVNGHRATLLVRVGTGGLGVYLRVLIWDAGGFTFMLETFLNGARERVLTTRQLLAIADGLRP